MSAKKHYCSFCKRLKTKDELGWITLDLYFDRCSFTIRSCPAHIMILEKYAVETIEIKRMAPGV